MKPIIKHIAVIIIAAAALGAQACSKNEYAELTAVEAGTFVDCAYPEPQRRMLAQSEQQRKNMVTQFKQMFAFAQAAVAAGLDKGERFTHNLDLNGRQMLAQEFFKQNPDLNISKDELDKFLAAHQKEFDADVKFMFEKAKEPPTPDQLEMLKAQWSDTSLRADKARQAGLDKAPCFQAQIKFARANLLANLYSEQLAQQYKATPAELQQYYVQHPEADGDKIKQRAEEILARIKKGEKFEELAKQINEDGSKESGGELPWFNEDGVAEDGVTYDPIFVKAAFALQPGQTGELVKSGLGYHIIKMDARRKAVKKPAAPTASPTPAASPSASPAAPSGSGEEVKSRHIYLTTAEVGSAEQKITSDKVKRAMEDATLKYVVKAADDFKLSVGGLRKPGSATPALGSGAGGSMRQIDPNANK